MTVMKADIMEVILKHGNARAAILGKTDFEMLQWKVLPYSLYTLDTATLDYNLFQLITHGLAVHHSIFYEHVTK